jgi:WD40 repeat protein
MSKFISVSDDGEAHVIDTLTGTKIAALVEADQIEGIARRGCLLLCVDLSLDGHLIAVGNSHNKIALFNQQTYAAADFLQSRHESWVITVRFSPDSSRLASASSDRTAEIFDTASRDCILTIRGNIH